MSTDKKSLHQLPKAIVRGTSLITGMLYFCTDMEKTKT